MPKWPDFTKTEQKLVDILIDGKPHKFEELFACIPDQQSKNGTLNFHLSKIRTKIRPVGRDILCVFRNRKRQYQMVRPLYSSED